MQGNGEILSDDFAQLINMNTWEVLRIRPGMFGGEKMQHIGMLTDGTVVIITRRDRRWAGVPLSHRLLGLSALGKQARTAETWQEYPETYPNLPFFLPGEEPSAEECKPDPAEHGKMCCSALGSANFPRRNGRR